MGTRQSEAPNVECADLWQPGTCTLECMLAYKVLERRGHIRGLHVDVGRRSGRMRIQYVADRGHDEVLGMLGEIKREMRTKAVTG